MMSELDWLNMNLSNNPSIQFRLKNIISKCKDGIPANTYDEINTIMDLLYGSYNANTAVESIYIYFNNAGRQLSAAPTALPTWTISSTRTGTTATSPTSAARNRRGANSGRLIPTISQAPPGRYSLSTARYSLQGNRPQRV